MPSEYAKRPDGIVPNVAQGTARRDILLVQGVNEMSEHKNENLRDRKTSLHYFVGRTATERVQMLLCSKQNFHAEHTQATQFSSRRTELVKRT